MTGGATALYATYILGSRRGRFFDATTGRPLLVPMPFPGHSVSLQMLGSFILWFGWFGFNPGGALLLKDNIHQGEIAALCAVNTFLSSAGGCISSMLLKMYLTHRKTGEFSFDLVAAMNGTLTGLVSVRYDWLVPCSHVLSLCDLKGGQLILLFYVWLCLLPQITGGCAILEPWCALIVGFVGGTIYLLGSNLLISFKIDDAVDAIPVHMFGGAWGKSTRFCFLPLQIFSLSSVGCPNKTLSLSILQGCSPLGCLLNRSECTRPMALPLTQDSFTLFQRGTMMLDC